MRRRRIRRELISAGSALLTGLLIMPLCIWLVGHRMLGPYSHGHAADAGPLALLGDFFRGLGQGLPAFWCVALGPLLLVLLVRGFLRLYPSLADGPVNLFRPVDPNRQGEGGQGPKVRP